MFIQLVFMPFFEQHYFSKPFPEDLKDLNLTNEEFSYLDPVTGFVWVEGGVNENY